MVFSCKTGGHKRQKEKAADPARTTGQGHGQNVATMCLWSEPGTTAVLRALQSRIRHPALGGGGGHKKRKKNPPKR